MEDLMEFAKAHFKECLEKWVDLPKRVYTEDYKIKFEKWIEDFIKARPIDDVRIVQYAVNSCLHHETGNRTPYIEFDENEIDIVD